MVTANPHGDLEAHVERMECEQEADRIARLAALHGGRRGDHEYLPTTEQQMDSWQPHRWVIDAIAHALQIRHDMLETEAYAEGRNDAEEERIPVPPRAVELLVQAMEYGHELWHGSVNKEDREGMGFNLKFGIKEYLQEVGYLMKDKKS